MIEMLKGGLSGIPESSERILVPHHTRIIGTLTKPVPKFPNFPESGSNDERRLELVNLESLPSETAHLSAEPHLESGVELWSTKALNLTWLPRRDNWNNPCLLRVSLPGAAVFAYPCDPKSNEVAWFWRVEPTFGAWVVRAIRRADQAKADLPGVKDAFPVIREYIMSAYPERWPEIERLSADPVKLPDAIQLETIDFIQFGAVPKWKGWDLAAERRTSVPNVSAAPVPDPATPQRRTKRRDDDGQSVTLFS